MKYTMLICALIMMLPARAVQAQTIENALLWKISSDKLSQPSYLYGTVHMICPEEMRFPDILSHTLQKTDQLVLEIDMDDPALMMKVQQFSLNQGQMNIQDKMTEEQIRIVSGFLQKKYGFSLKQIGIMKPISLMSMVLPVYVECSTPASYEGKLMEIAKKDSIEILGVETIQEQLQILDDTPMEEQIKMLVESIRDSAEMKAELQQTINAYLEEDLQTLYQISKNNPQYEFFEEVMINNRNRSWVAPMEKYMQQKPTFFAFGALHLPGESGVIALLRRAGYEVTPLRE